jgi:hypothetical protein
VFDDVAAAWWDDTKAGRLALIVVDTASDAADVNTRCQLHLLAGGRLGAHIAEASDGTRIHVGDTVQTRCNTSVFHASDGQRILNRDVWTVTGLAGDGSLQVRHATRAASAVLPAGYVTDDVVLAYATTIAGGQGRTVQRGHVVVTPRTTSASLYVGMTRGREANHAHVVCDSHDHVEFELGDLTPEQAFAAATVRDADGQLSANSVKQRWNEGRPDRATARSVDRKYRQLVDWWTTKEKSLPPAMRAALGSDHHRVIELLERFPNEQTRQQGVNNAASVVNWRQPNAVDQFLHRLQRISPTTAHHHGNPPQAEQSAGRER